MDSDTPGQVNKIPLSIAILLSKLARLTFFVKKMNKSWEEM